MSEEICTSCRQAKVSKTPIHCGLCQSLLCKDCTQFLDPEALSFLSEIPKESTHNTYCGTCYSRDIVPTLESYADVMKRAQQVHIFYKNERNVPYHTRSKKPLTVENCPDRKEVLLRLAFLAAQQSCDAVIDIVLNSEKMRNAGYQKTNWSGTGLAARMKAVSQ